MNKKFILLFSVLIFLIFLAIYNGPIPLRFSTLFGFSGNEFLDHEQLNIILEYRWSKLITAMVACAGLSLAGLLMQTYFQNPLAGPDVFGLTTAASLGVACAIFAQSYLFHFTEFELSFLGFSVETLFGFLASMGAYLLINLFSKKLKSSTVLLIVGLLLGSFFSGIISVFISISSRDELRNFISWGLGSFEKLNLIYAFVLGAIIFGIYLLVFFMSRALNLFYLGENYSKTSGLNVPKFKSQIIFVTCFLTSLVTAACGPLAFVGIVAPHLTKYFFKTSDHKVLIPGIFLIGAIFGLIVTIILSLPFTLPIPANAIMGFIGAPLLMIFLLKKERVVL